MKIPLILAETDVSSVLNNGLPLGEKLTNGASMILFGMLMVFAVIFIIWLVLTIFKALVATASGTGNTKAPENKTQPAQAPAVSQPISQLQTETDDGVTVAVITAAVAAYLSEQSDDGTYLPFRVVSFKRKKNGSPWNSEIK